MTIGNFQQHDSRFVGTIMALTFETEAVIEPIDKRGEKDHRRNSCEASGGDLHQKVSAPA